MRRRLSLLLIVALALPAALAVPAALAQETEVASDHFVVMTDGGEKQARRVIDNFERMRWMFQVLFPRANVDPPAPIRVIATKNKKSFQALEPQEYLAKGALNIGGYFLQSEDKNYILLPLEGDGPHPWATVYHEYTHFQFAADGEWMPLWLSEGLAEFFQNTDFHDKEVILGQPNADDILYLRENATIPLATLFRVDHNSPYYHDENKGSVFYSESWALTHFLEVQDRQKGTHRVTDYLLLMAKRSDPVDAATQAFGDLKQLEKALNNYIHQQAYNSFILSTAASKIDEANYKVRPITQTEFDANRADFLAHVGRNSDAKALIESVNAADPKNLLTRETEGWMAFRTGDREGARKYFAQAVALDSKSYLAHYYYAWMSISVDAEDAQIETSLRAAIALNAKFAPSYDLLASWYAKHHEKLEEAQALNLKAVQLDRGNLYYRVNGANLLLMRGNAKDAERVLISANPLAKTPEERAMLETRLEQAERAEKAATGGTGIGSGQEGAAVTVKTEEAAPRHPTEAADGAKHAAVGVIRGVECSYPSVIEFKLENALAVTPAAKSAPAKKPALRAAAKTAEPAPDAKPAGGKTLGFYSNNYYKLEYSAVGFTPDKDMNPCKDLEGATAQVRYAESSDKTVDGQVIAIEVRK